MKDETYSEYKYPRGINSRSDLFKCFVGPVFQAISDVLFSRPEFIKKVPVKDRPSYIMSFLQPEGKRVLATDFTSFEAQFTEDIMKCEIIMYKHMTAHLPNREALWHTFDKVLAGKNFCHYREMLVELKATRMSGEMCTSLGNGFSNLMFNLFMLKQHGVPLNQVRIVVEGDDGLFTIPPRFSDFSGKSYAELGLVVKLINVSDITEASFCGLIFDPEDLVNITDPLKVLASFGWACARYGRSKLSKLKSLLRCKALSYAHQYPGCPIIQALALYGLRHTEGIDIRRTALQGGWWERELRQSFGVNLPCKPVPGRTRLLMERIYRVTVDLQLRTETYLEGAEYGELNIPWLSGLADGSWTSYSTRYTCRTRSWYASGWIPCFGFRNSLLPTSMKAT